MAIAIEHEKAQKVTIEVLEVGGNVQVKIMDEGPGVGPAGCS